MELVPASAVLLWLGFCVVEDFLFVVGLFWFGWIFL